MTIENELIEELDSTDLGFLREKCKTDLFFFAKAILNYGQVEEGAHAALCAFMVHERSNRRMVLMPRGFLKSTICTIADSIRLSLINPNVRILIQNEVFDNASNFLYELEQHWERSVLLRSLFPELVPPKFSGPGCDWSKNTASIIRDTVAKESTYTASGSGGSPQSQHFEFIKNDDLIGEKARLSETVMKQAIGWVDAMRPLLDKLSDQMDFYGTRKTLTDVYAHVGQKYKSRLKTFIREPLESGVSIFTKFSIEDLTEIMVDTPDVWAYDYMNNPMGEGGFDWGNTYTQYFDLFDDKVVYEDFFSQERLFWKLSELFIVITVDPNGGKKHSADKAAIIVHGISPKDQIFVLDAWDGRPSPSALVDKIFETCCIWNPQKVGIEEAGQQTTIFYFEKEMAEHNRYFTVVPTTHFNIEKSLKIRQALDQPIKARRLFFQPHQLTLISQVQLHPQLATHNWDQLDALSQGPQVYRSGMAEEDLKKNEEAHTKVLQFRGPTGYGVTTDRFRGADDSSRGAISRPYRSSWR